MSNFIIGEGEEGNQENEQEYHHDIVNHEEVYESDEDRYYKKRKRKNLYSEVWTKFTVVSRKNTIASCNICGAKLSFRTTTSNLKKHISRKHNYDVDKSCIISYQQKAKTTSTFKKTKLTELGGLDGLVLNVVADEGEDPTQAIANEEVITNEVQDDMQGYCTESGNTGGYNIKITSLSGAKPQPALDTTHTSQTSKYPNASNNAEKKKRHRIIDLQLECLELKKYSMQMETLLLEQQLNLPRSIYTENLRGCNNVTRGTQTDVGGGNTKVFYVSDSQMSGREGTPNIFSFQGRLME